MLQIPSSLQESLGGRYVLQREIGRGGAAAVYLARDVRHERLVAVKVLHPELSHALGTQRFLREIRLTAGLQHPHILPIHDSGEAAGLLYYVMPYVEGESLRQRLAGDNRLSLADAARIGREMASALAYAHERGVVHRDIKPENILFSGGHAILADFGIARAIDRASEKITQQGMITGTPAYMSPEQARDREFDGRSDVYSLACVLYESIAGVPPFAGDTPHQLLSARIHKTPPLLRVYRHDVPPPLEAVIARALSTSPDDRFDDARAFSAALSAAIGNSGETGTAAAARRRLTRSPWTWAAGVTLLAAGGAATSPGGRERLDLLTGRVDSAQYAVAPFEYVGSPTPADDQEPVAQGIYAALREWDGLPVASESMLRDALRRTDDLTLDARLDATRHAHAGKLIWGRVYVAADSVRVRATLYDALGRRVLREITMSAAAGEPVAQPERLAALTRALLRNARQSIAPRADRGTRSYPAWNGFERGAALLDRWQVDSAAVLLQRAAELDPDYPQANLWLAQLRAWREANTRDWSSYYVAATRHRDRLSPREQHLLDALGAFAHGEPAAACGSYRALLRADTMDAFAWLGLALCETRDEGVVPAPRSPSGFVFRGSYERAFAAASHMLELAPRAFVVFPYDLLRRVVQVESHRVRVGRLGARVFLASPDRAGDSVAYVPYPAEQFATVHAPARYDEALAFNRDRLLLVIEALTRRLPASPDAFEALAHILETRDEITGTPNGGYSALSAVERARALSGDPLQQLRLVAAEVRLHVKLGDFARATAIADSALGAAADPSPEAAGHLAGLAAYTGRVGAAVAYSRAAGLRNLAPDVPAVPAADGLVTALFVRSALGVCDDSTRRLLPRAIDDILRSYVAPRDRARTRDRFLERATVLALPCTGAAGTLALSEPLLPITQLAQRAARGESVAVRRALDSLAAARRALRPGELSLDVLVQEAWLRAAVGDSAGAAAMLDLPLGALPTLSTFVVSEPGMAASIGRAMALRAELAARLHDRDRAALWAARVLTVWGHADSSLRPQLVRMRALAARRG